MLRRPWKRFRPFEDQSTRFQLHCKVILSAKSPPSRVPPVRMNTFKSVTFYRSFYRVHNLWHLYNASFTINQLQKYRTNLSLLNLSPLFCLLSYRFLSALQSRHVLFFFLMPCLLLFFIPAPPHSPHPSSLPVSSVLLLLSPPRCWKASPSVSRPISASIWTARCCRTARLLKAPPRAVSGRWPWSLRPPTLPPVTHWSTLETSWPPSISYPGDP